MVFNPELYEEDKVKNHDVDIEEDGIRWRSDELSPLAVDWYLCQARRVWPPLYKYREESALQFLHLKNYKIDMAVLSIIYDVEQLVALINMNKRQQKTH
mmetsp:Transcript_15947/g.24676  ORF Transcript_15947/g.24676 Transcript_15947/m.24676 type:complete len:99 (+) Transcript_15947:1236-1532(+)